LTSQNPAEGGTDIFLTRVEDTAEALKKALAAGGDLGFLKRGDSVLIKPAVNSGNKWPATSSPELISLLVKTLKDRGASDVIVGDRTAMIRDTEKCMKSCGILDAARDAGAKVVFFENEKFVDVNPPGAKYWRKKIAIPQLVKEIDHVISLPTVRTHMVAGFTMTIKNWVGIVPNNMRLRMHVPFGFKERLGELMLLRKPDLVLLDGRRAYIAGGPDSGKEVKPGLFAAGVDPIALDVLGLAILTHNGAGKRISGKSPWENKIIRRAVEVGSGVKSGSEIKLNASNVAEIDALKKIMNVPL